MPKETKGYSLRSNAKNKLKKSRDDPESDDDTELFTDSDYETVDEDDESSSYKPKPKTNKKRSNKKRIISSDDEDEEEDWIDEDDDEEIDEAEMKKFISRIFPSKYMSNRAKAAAEDKKEAQRKKKQAAQQSKKKKAVPQKKKAAPQKKKGRRVQYEDEEEDEEDDEDDEEEDDEDDEEEDEEDEDEEDEEDDEDEDEDEEEEEEEGVYSFVFSMDPNAADGEFTEYKEDDEDCDSDDERTFMKESYKPIEIPDRNQTLSGVSATSSNKVTGKRSATQQKRSGKKSKTEDDNKTTSDNSDITDVEQEYIELAKSKAQLTELLRKQPNSRILRAAVNKCNKTIKKLVKKARSKNAKSYHKLIHQDKKKTNEIDYFRKKLSNKEQLRVMKDLKEINQFINVDKPYRLALLDSTIPNKFKAIALQKLNVLKSMDPGDNEYYKIKNWVDTFMRVPFGFYKNLSVKMEDGLDVCHEFMENAKGTLDKCVYGLNDAKLQIMQMMGQWISNPSSLGTAIAIKGPPGTGKTSLVKEGISKILGREFAFIALGGAGDSSFLEGHSYTYEGSSWGKIVQIIIDSKCMNPVIYFDELDKISDTPRGEEIVGILTHLTDTSQNSQFHDKYFSEIDFDLSKCLFIFSYNDESKVNPILRDRMYRIQTKGYDAKEKLIIARNFLLPKIREQVNFTEQDVIIPDETIQYIISNSDLSKGEDGVRNLKRCLEIIYTKLNLFRLVKPGSNLFGKDIDLKVEFPFTVTKKEVDIFIKNEQYQNQSMLAMYC